MNSKYELRLTKDVFNLITNDRTGEVGIYGDAALSHYIGRKFGGVDIFISERRMRELSTMDGTGLYIEDVLVRLVDKHLGGKRPIDQLLGACRDIYVFEVPEDPAVTITAIPYDTNSGKSFDQVVFDGMLLNICKMRLLITPEGHTVRISDEARKDLDSRELTMSVRSDLFAKRFGDSISSYEFERYRDTVGFSRLGDKTC